MAQDSSLTPTILVAEDEPAMLSLVARHLGNQGYRVLEAPDGAVAWELAQEHTPDLVVLDVMMPEMSGWDVCRKIKSHAAGGPFERTGVIMLTGIGESLNELTSPLFQADEHLDKPFDFADLDKAIRATLARYGKSVPTPPGPSAVAAPEVDEAEAPAEEEAPESDLGAPEAPSEERPRVVTDEALEALEADEEAPGSSEPAAEEEEPATEPPARKRAGKKAPAKKAAAKKRAGKKAPAKKAAAKKRAGKKAPAKKVAAKKRVGKKAPAKKAAAKPRAGRKAPAKKAAAKRGGAKKGATPKGRARTK
jgi:DNA-binding response OmpR family regulator